MDDPILLEVGKRYKFRSDKNGIIGISYWLFDNFWCYGKGHTTPIKSSVFIGTIYSIDEIERGKKLWIIRVVDVEYI